MGYYEGEIGNVGCNNGSAAAWDWSWIIGLVVVGGLFGNGWGVGNGRGGNPATQADLANGFAQNTLQRGIDDIILGQAQAINYNNQGFAGLNAALSSGFASTQNALCQGFSGVDRAIADSNAALANSVCTLGYNMQTGFSGIQNQIASCCCDLKALNLENRYLNEKQTCDIVTAINAGNQRLVDIYTNDKIAQLTSENASLKSAISNDAQTATLLNAINRTPVPAYVVSNPYCCTQYPYGACGASVQ